MDSAEGSSFASGTFPCKEPTLPFWRTGLHELDSHRSTEELPHSCDVLIIGGGYAGITASYHLLCGENSSTSPKLSIVLTEAREACSGATARNGLNSSFEMRDHHHYNRLTRNPRRSSSAVGLLSNPPLHESIRT